MNSQKPHLTPRQREVVRLISLGCTNEQAAAILGLSPATVDNHKTRAMRNLGTDKAVLVTRIALKHRFTHGGCSYKRISALLPSSLLN